MGSPRSGTSELYLEGQSTWVDSTVFTGWRLENRFKPLHREHWINPVLYLEYEDLNEASRIQKEIEGGGPNLSSHNALLTPEHDHELESKLILSSDYHDWNISENFIAAKNFSQSEGVEFGYAFGASRHWQLSQPGLIAGFAARTSFSAPKCTGVWAARLASACTTQRTTLRQYCHGWSATTRICVSLLASD
jgi:hypothetical protein